MMNEFPYLAVDIAKMLNHTKVSMLLKFVEREEKIMKSIFYGGQNRNMFHLSLNGVIQIISKSRKISSTEKENLIKQFTDENIIYVGASKEAEFLTKLERQLLVFDITNFSRQHIVNGKRIDLYLPQVNVAIEYDESTHSGYSYENEEYRQEMIENELDCTFIRVSDKQDDETNCAIVLKQLFKMQKVA